MQIKKFKASIKGKQNGRIEIPINIIQALTGQGIS